MIEQLQNNITNTPGFAEQLIDQLYVKKSKQSQQLMTGLAPEQFKQCQALVKAYDAAIDIVKKTKIKTNKS